MELLQFYQLEKSIGNTVLFSEINLDVNKGDAVAIHCNTDIGHSLIQIMIGQLPLSHGKILLSGASLNTNFKLLSNRIGISFLNESVYERLTVKAYLQFFKNLYQVPIQIDHILQLVGLTEKSTVSNQKLTFSEKKRLLIARAIIHQPELVILEEPDQNVDIESKLIIKRVIDYVTSQGSAVLITTSNLESAITLTNNVYRLNETGLKELDVMDEEQSEESVSQVNKDVIEDEFITLNQISINKIPAKVDEKIILFDPTEIDYIESNDGISHLHVKGEVFPSSYTLSELFERLQPFGFFRCHRSYIVNLQKVREVITWTRNSYSLILEDSQKSSIPLSKGKLNDLKQIIGL